MVGCVIACCRAVSVVVVVVLINKKASCQSCSGVFVADGLVGQQEWNHPEGAAVGSREQKSTSGHGPGLVLPGSS